MATFADSFPLFYHPIFHQVGQKIFLAFVFKQNNFVKILKRYWQLVYDDPVNSHFDVFSSPIVQHLLDYVIAYKPKRIWAFRP